MRALRCSVPNLALAVAAAVALTACPRPSYYRCQVDADCVDPAAGSEPRCELGSCSYFDETCPSDRRFGEQAAPGLAGTCVAAADVDGGPTDGRGPGSCPGEPDHRNVCIPGACIDRGAGPCVDAVCAIDPACCETAWSDGCVALAATTCPAIGCAREIAIGSYTQFTVAHLAGTGATPLWTRPAGGNNEDGRQVDMAWADHDGDGDIDLGLPGECLVTIDTNNGVAGALQWGPRFELAPPDADPDDGCGAYVKRFQGRDVAWGDVDRDGDLELAVAGNHGLLVLRREGATWVPTYLEPAAATPVAASDVLWVDLDHDRWLDLVVGYDDRPVAVYHNDRGTLVRSETWAPSPTGTLDLVACNLDGDPEPELVIATGQLVVVDNAAGRLTTLAGVHTTLAVRCADVDADGANELVTIDDADDRIRIWEVAPGTLALTEAWVSTGATFTMSFDRGAGLDVGDWDGDGDLDLVAIDNAGLAMPPVPWFVVLEQVGPMAFTARPGTYLGPVDANPPWSLAVGLVSLAIPASR